MEFTPAMVESAAHELGRAPALGLPGSPRPWSHGDVHLKNLPYDAAGQRAWLIDFETRHEDGMTAEEHHADDLLVFLMDLEGRVPEGRGGGLSEAFLRAYSREDVLGPLLPRLHPPRGLERALRKSRSQHLSEARLLGWLERLRRQVLGRLEPESR